MSVALVLFLGGVVVTLWLYFFTRQQEAHARPIAPVKLPDDSRALNANEGVIIVRGLGQVVHANGTIRKWLGIDVEVPDLEQITRLVKPSDNFLMLLGSTRQSAFQIGDQWMEAAVYDVPHENDDRRMIVVREVGVGDDTSATVGGIDFSRAFRVLNQAAELVDITAGIEPTLQAILTVLHPVIHFDGGQINLFTEDGTALTPQAWFGDARYMLELYEHGGQYPLEGGITGWLLKNRKPLILNSTTDINALNPLVSPFPYESVVGVPLMIANEVLGTIELFSDSPNAYDSQSATLLLALNESLGRTIGDAQQYAQQVRRVEDLVSLQGLVEQASGRSDARAETVYGALARRVAELSGAQMCGILLYDNSRAGLTAALPFHGIPDALARSLIVPLPSGSAARDIFERQPYWLAGDLRDEPLAEEMGLDSVMSTIGIRNTLWVPLQISRERIGMLVVFNKLRGTEFTTRDVANLKAIASQATVVVESIRLFSREQRLDAELEGLQQMTFAIGALTAEGDFFKELTSRIAALMNVQSCGLLLLDEREERLIGQIPASGISDAIMSQYNIDFTDGSVFHALWQDEDSWYTNNTMSSALIIASDLEDVTRRAGIQRVMYARLTLRGQMTGIIQIADPANGRDFDDGDGRLLTIFATQAATILENARLFREVQRQSQHSEVMRRLAEVAGAMTTVGGSAQALLQAVSAATDSPIAFFSLLDSSGNLVTLPEHVYGTEITEPTIHHAYSPSFRHTVMRSRRPYLGNDVLNDPLITEEYRVNAKVTKVQSAVIVPLVVGERGIGELGVANRHRPYDRVDLPTLGSIAEQIAPAVERALLYESTSVNLARRLEELDAVGRVSNELTLTVDFDQIMNVIRREAQRATASSNSTVALFTQPEAWASPMQPVLLRRIGSLRDTASFDTVAPVERLAVEYGTEAAVIRDYAAMPDYAPVPHDARSALAVSILYVDTVIGVIHLWDTAVDKFDDISAQFLLTLATKASLGYGNYIRYQELRERSDTLRQRVEQLNRIFELSSVLSSSTDPAELLEAVAFSVQQSAGYDQVVMMLADENGVLHRTAQAGLPIDLFRQSMVSTVTDRDLRELLTPEYQVGQSSAFLLDKTQRDKQRDALETRFDGQREIEYVGSDAWHDGDLLITIMTTPAGRVLGAILLDRPFNDRRPDRSTADLLETFAYQAANAVESTALFNQAVRLRVLNESVVNSIQQGIVVLDQSGRIIAINRTMRETLHWTDVAIGSTIDEYRPEIGSIVGYAVQLVLAGGQPQELLEEQTYDENDRPQLLNLYVYPLTSQENTGAVLVIEDVTEQKALEQAIQVRADQLGALTEASNRVTASTERGIVVMNAMTEMQRLLAYRTMAIWRRAGSVLTLEDATGNLWEGVVTEGESEERATKIRINDYLAMRQVVDTQKTLAVNLPPDEPTEYDPMPPGVEEALSWLGVPMVNQGNVVGVITLASDQSGAYDSLSDQNVAFAFASQVANAAANAELFMQAFERTNEMSTLLEAAQVTAATRELPELLGIIASLMFGVVEVERCAVMFWHEVDNMVELVQDSERMGATDGLRAVGTRYDLGQFKTKAQVLRTREPQIITSKDDPDIYGEDVHEMRERGEVQRIFIPLNTADGAIGLVQLEQFSGSPREITAQNMRMIRTLGGQLAVGIQNARLSQEMSNMVAESFALNDLSQTLSAALSAEQVMQIVRGRLPDVFKAPEYYVALLNEETGMVSFPVAYRNTRQVTIPSRPLANDEVSYILTNNRMLNIGADYFTPEAMRASIGIETTEIPYLSYVGVPISVGSRAVGAIVLLDANRTRAFSLNDQRVLTTVSSQLASVLQNATLFGQISQLAEDLERQVTERTQELAGERDRLDTLYRITSELTRTLDMSQLEERALGMLINAIGADDGIIMRQDSLTGQLITMTRYHSHEGLADEVHPGEQIGRWLIATGGEIVIPDLHHWEHWDASVQGGGDWQSAIAATLTTAEGDPLGVIVMMSLFADAFDEPNVRLVSAASRQIAATINNAQLYTLIQDQASRLSTLLRTEQEEAEKNAAILDSISDGVLLSDALGRVLVSNPAAQRLLSQSSENLNNRPLQDIAAHFGGSIASWIEGILRYSEHAREDDPPTEARLALYDAIISTATSPVFSEGNFVGMVSVLRDITRDVEVDRMKSEFVSNVSHELRTPLTPIKGFTEMLMMGALGPVTDPQKNTLAMIKDNVTRLTVLVEDILDISRIDSGREKLNVDDVDLAAVVREAIDKQTGRPQHKDKMRTFDVQIAPDLPQIQADRGKLLRIFNSIIDNALNYTRDGGTVGVTTGMQDGRVLVSIADDGVGIPEQYREAVWRRFQRVEEHALQLEVSGTGLGLSIVKEMVEMHHGEVWFTSQVGKGTTFTVALPLTQPAQVTGAAAMD